MKRILGIMFMALLVPSLGMSQGWKWSTDANVMWIRPALSWHDDELSLRGPQTILLASLTGESPQIKFSYSLTTGFGMEDTIIPRTPLFISSTNFGKEPTQTGQQGGQDKPVQVEWAMGPISQLQVGGPQWRGMRPIAICAWSGITMKGMKDDGGKNKSDSETLQAAFLGLGARADYAAGRSGGHALVVGSKGYLFGEVEALLRLNRYAAIKTGYQWRTLKFDRATVRINGGYAGVEVVF